MFKFLISSLALLFALLTTENVVASRQKIHLFEYGGQLGNVLTITRKTPGLGSLKSFAENSPEFCVEGWWKVYADPNYRGFSMQVDNDFGSGCYSFTLPFMVSLRHFGPPDTATPAVTLYSAREYDGDELVVSYKAEPAVPFHTGSAFVTGGANWTFFDRPNYAGASYCYESAKGVELVRDIKYLEWGLATIGSVKQGCEEMVCVEWKPASAVAEVDPAENEV